MIGPVFQRELVLTGRKTRFNVARRSYAGCLVVLLAVIYAEFFVDPVGISLTVPATSGNEALVPAQFVRWCLLLFWYQLVFLAFVLAPALMGGAVAGEKAARTLPQLLTTELAAWEIVLGKFLGRVSPLLLLGVVAIPFVALAAGLGGVGWFPLVVLCAYPLVMVLAVSAVALAVSVWCRTTLDAVLTSYALLGLAAVGLVGFNWGAALASTPPSWVVQVREWLEFLSPTYYPDAALSAGTSRGQWWRALQTVLVGCGGIVALILGLASLALRRACDPQLGPGRSGLAGWTRRPRVFEDFPVRWKEHYLEGLAPVPWLRRVPAWLGVPGVFVGTLGFTLWMIWPAGATFQELCQCLRTHDFIALSTRLGRNVLPDQGFLIQAVLMLFVSSLVVMVRGACSITGEREKQTWEPLLLTAVTTGELVRGKVFGVLGAAFPYLGAYALAALPLAILAGQMEFLVTVTSLWLAWPLIYVAGAMGLANSAKAKSSWRSLLTSLGEFYFTCLSASCMMAPVAGCLGGGLNFLITATGVLRRWGVQSRFQDAITIALTATAGLTAMCWFASRHYLQTTERWLEDHERTPARATAGGRKPADAP